MREKDEAIYIIHYRSEEKSIKCEKAILGQDTYDEKLQVFL